MQTIKKRVMPGGRIYRPTFIKGKEYQIIDTYSTLEKAQKAQRDWKRDGVLLIIVETISHKGKRWGYSLLKRKTR